MSERSSPPPPGGREHQVLEYLAALEARRATTSGFPHPDRIVDDLASGEMGQPTDEPEALHEELAASTPGTEANLARLEEGFVAGAREYARRHGVSYEGWIRAGVDPGVLERAGIRPDPH